MTRDGADDRTSGVLSGLRVIEAGDEQAEYAGLLLASLGADVVKVEPPGGSPSRGIGPYADGRPDIERSIHFWQYNRGKRSIVLDPSAAGDQAVLDGLMARSDVLLHSWVPADGPNPFSGPDLARRYPAVIVADMTPFGDSGPWSRYRASDLVHLALGGPVMNCGYDPRPDGTYDLPPMAPQSWHSYIIAGEQLVIGLLAALVHRERTGEGQSLSLAVHEAVAKSTELDLMNWVMRRAPLHRQTCRHAAERVSVTPTIAPTKDGRWMITNPMGATNEQQIIDFIRSYDLVAELDPVTSDEPAGRAIPGSSVASERDARVAECIQRLTRKFTYEELPWEAAQDAGIVCAPLRMPHENLADEHWAIRETFASVDHPDEGRSFSYAVRKWSSTAPDWVVGRRAPLLGEDGDAIRRELTKNEAPQTSPRVAVRDSSEPQTPRPGERHRP